MRTINLVLKRSMDIFGSLIGIILLLPVLIIVALAIKIDSKGPVFFRQERLGKKGIVFKILKFRTMVIDAESKGLGVKTEINDPRITKVGNFLRKTSLDELPQLLNVLLGTMSLIGPRPPVPYHPYRYEDYKDEMKKRFLFRPGITGYSQVKVRNSAPWDKRIEYDIEYIEKFNIFIDIKILFLTFIKVIKKDSIYRS